MQSQAESVISWRATIGPVGWIKRAAGVGIAGRAVWAAVAVWAFRFPSVDPPARTDAYFLLSSSGGLAAFQAGLDDYPKDAAIVLSTPDELRALPAYQKACARTDREIHCISPVPVTTQGESIAFAALARDHGWQSVTVISQVSHTTRARMLIQRCFPGEVRMAPEDTEHGIIWARSLVYETGASIKALVLRGCDSDEANI